MKGLKTKVLAVLALTVALSACSDEFGPQPDQLLSPESADLARGRDHGRDEGPDRAKGPDRHDAKEKGPRVRGRKKNGKHGEFRLALQHREPSRNKASGWIGAEGGRLRFDGHTLTVPAGAVDGPTFFSMKEALQNIEQGLNALAFDLDAVGWNGRSYTDVGAAGFDVPVVLCVNYDSAIGHELENIEEATILWLQNLVQETEVAESWADRGKHQVCGKLEHFSRWALAWPM